MVWSPSSKYTEVNISYSGGGLLAAINRGEWSERLEYENDKVVSRAWVNGKIWSYTYADRVRAHLSDSASLCQAYIRSVASPTHSFVSWNLIYSLFLFVWPHGCRSHVKPK